MQAEHKCDIHVKLKKKMYLHLKFVTGLTIKEKMFVRLQTTTSMLV